MSRKAYIFAFIGLVAFGAWSISQAAQCGLTAAGKPACASAACTADGEKAPEVTAVISTAALDTLLAAKVPFVLLDARSGKYDDGRRIPGAKSLNSESSAEEVKTVIPAKNTLVVTYCANPNCPASHKLAKHLASLGYSNIMEYPEGIDGWVAAGKDVTKAGK